MQVLRQAFRNILAVFTAPVLFFYALPWLMFLLVAGTVAQRYAGLYASEKLFFGSFVLWLGPLPTPGAYTTLGLIAASLTAKLALKSPFEKQQIGVIITHVSALVLLVGGCVSAVAREEGYMVLGEGETGASVSDYRLHELAIVKNEAVLFTVPQAQLQEGAVIKNAALPFVMHIRSYCSHCSAVRRSDPQTGLQGVAKDIALVPATAMKEEEENKPGVAFDVSGASSQDGTYIASEALARQPLLALGNDHYAILMRPAQRPLPFSLRLLHFEKSDYPGTDMARAYRSDVAVSDGALTWNASIEMNQPLRLKGYTLYQSSFEENNGKYFTVLAVVKNAGALFPYIAIAMLCAGLAVHLGIMFVRKPVV